MRRRFRPLAAAVIAVAAIGSAAAPAAAQDGSSQACSSQPDFRCGTLSVPLDRSGRVPGTVRLRYAAQRSFPSRRRVVVALTGGPGQAGVDAATSFEFSLDPLLSRYRLVTLDQRGTGDSGVLRCPASQRQRGLSSIFPGTVAACAARVGARRIGYSTADTVLDLEALRVRLGADKLALMGISYGTHVALQYARAFPANVDRLILDSVVGPDGPDPFLLDSFRAVPRLLREECRGRRCRGITEDPVADVGTLVRRLNAAGGLRGTFFDARGRERATRYRTSEELWFLLVAGDLNPFLRAAVPGAIAAAVNGDRSLLMRLRRIAAGEATPVKELSWALNVITSCYDAPLPWSAATPIGARPAIAQGALAAIPPAQYTPFDGATVLRTGYVDDCLRFPQDTPRAPFSGPLPDVPALLLGGRDDFRTPIENAVATQAQLPRSSVVAVRGSGHDAIDNDVSGCVNQALRRFMAGRTVGTPCASTDNAVRPLPLPPTSLRDFRSAPGVGGTRGRAVFAVLDTLEDARLTSLQTLLAGLSSRGGGLHGGRFSGPSDVDGTIRLTRYAYLRGLRVTGRVTEDGADLVGRVSVRGPRGTSGSLTITANGVTGRLGGSAVRYRGSAGAGAAAAGAHAHRVDGSVIGFDARLARAAVRRAAARRG